MPNADIRSSTIPLEPCKEQLRRDGWCVVPDVFTREFVGEAVDRLWAATEESKRRGWKTFMPEIDPNAANVRVFHLLELDGIFRRIVRDEVSLALVTALLGENVIISNSVANIARPGARSMGLHSDISLVVPAPWQSPWSINIITCLTDATFENGATLYIPGSHLWRTREDVPPDANRRLVPFTARAGSIIAMDGRMWHTSGANITDAQDRALQLTYYTVPFLRQQINWSACLSPDVVDRLDDRLLEMLGLDIHANMSLLSDLRYLDVQYGDAEVS